MKGLAQTHGIALVGLKGVAVDVQTHIGPGIVGTTLVGLPDASLRESKERVRAALFSCGIPTLNRRVTVNLSPADLPKAGSSFDLAIAVSMLVARGLVPSSITDGTVFIAELGLDGTLRPVPGVLPAAQAAQEAGFTRVLVPVENYAEAELAGQIMVSGCGHLQHLLSASRSADPWATLETLGGIAQQQELMEADGLQFPKGNANAEGGRNAGPFAPQRSLGGFGDELPDLADVRGQGDAIDALTIAAVGGHHCLFHGPPGAGKTMLAACLPGILPPLTHDDAVAVTALRSLSAGSVNTGRVAELITRPPLEAPHHSATLISLVGGGNPIRPGAISLAHGGVLVLDEAPEFPQRTLEALRQPLESSEITIHRAQAQVTFPARFQLVLTANPCPCGGDSGAAVGQCVCQPMRIRRYRSRLSGPLLDRIDLQVYMTALSAVDESKETEPSPPSAIVREQVIEARNRTSHRLKDTPWTLNSQVPGRYLRSANPLPAGYHAMVEDRVRKGSVSLRGADRILRLAWSIADLEGHTKPTSYDLDKAMGFRGLTAGQNSWI